MTREILFRGKRMDNGEWVKGYLICPEFDKLINTNTIGTVTKRSDGGAIVHIERDSIGQDGTIKPLETYNTIRSLLLDVRRYTDETTP